MEISVVIPAYKEAENLKGLLPKLNGVLKPLSEQTEIIVVDTMEPTDNAREVCEKNNAQYVNRKGSNSYGSAIRTGIACAAGKYVVIMDADGSHDPNYIAGFYREAVANDYDLIIGSRYCKGGKTENPPILQVMSYVLNLSYTLLFGLKVKDVSDSFRMYKAEKLKQIETECDNFDIVEEIIIKLNYTFDPFTIKEVPITFYKRQFGESKRDLVKFIFSYLKTIDRLLKIKKKIKR